MPGRPAEDASLSAARVVADAALCVRFFSRLPLPRLNRMDDPDRAPEFSRSSHAAPLAGMVVGAPAALLLLLLSFTALPPLASAALVAGLLAAITGALHEDGLGDVADGFFGGATVERRLEIMKDSRVGAFGALTLAAAFVLKTALIAGLLTRFGAGAAAVLLAGEALSRWAMLTQWQRLPSARPEGLGTRFGRPDAGQVLLGGAWALLGLMAALGVAPFSTVILGAACAMALAHLTSRLALAKIGGFTGDVLGAVQQVSQMGFLIGLQLLAP